MGEHTCALWSVYEPGRHKNKFAFETFTIQLTLRVAVATGKVLLWTWICMYILLYIILHYVCTHSIVQYMNKRVQALGQQAAARLSATRITSYLYVTLWRTARGPPGRHYTQSNVQQCAHTQIAAWSVFMCAQMCLIDRVRGSRMGAGALLPLLLAIKYSI